MEFVLHQSSWFRESEWRAGFNHACLQHKTDPQYLRIWATDAKTAKLDTKDFIKSKSTS